MMSYTSFLIAKSGLILSIASQGVAMEYGVPSMLEVGSSPQPQEVKASPHKTYFKNVDSISGIKSNIDRYLERGIIPHEIFVVLDVDGTITNKGTPDTEGPFNIAQPRGLAPEMIHWMIGKGINVIFSSAWTTFNQSNVRREQPNSGFFQTTQRLSSPGLRMDRYLSGTSEPINSSLNGKTVEGMKQGQTISIAIDEINTMDKKYKFYRQKAFTPYFYDLKKSKDMKVLIFADDSLSNVKAFDRDLEWFNPYLSLRYIDLYTLNDNYDFQEKAEIAKELAPYAN